MPSTCRGCLWETCWGITKLACEKDYLEGTQVCLSADTLHTELIKFRLPFLSEGCTIFLSTIWTSFHSRLYPNISKKQFGAIYPGINWNGEMVAHPLTPQELRSHLFTPKLTPDAKKHSFKAKMRLELLLQSMTISGKEHPNLCFCNCHQSRPAWKGLFP